MNGLEGTTYNINASLTCSKRHVKHCPNPITKLSCTVLKKQWAPGYYTINIPPGKDIFKTIKKFNGLNEVLFSEPSSVGFNDDLYIPDDPQFAKQWHLHNVGQTGGRPDADVDALEAWNIEQGDYNVAIAIIDTGVDLDHENLQVNILPRPAGEDWDFAASDLVPEDEHYDETHYAGIAASVDNASGITGLAPGCSILPKRIDLTAGHNANRADAINFVSRIASRYTRVVISCSWRASRDITGIHTAIVNANNNNIVICFAAENANTDMDVAPQYPGAYSEVISVASIDHNDVKSSFSNYGSMAGLLISVKLLTGAGDPYKNEIIIFEKAH